MTLIGRQFGHVRRLAFVVVLALVAGLLSAGASTTQPLPRLLDTYLSRVNPSSGERRRLLAGEPFAKLLDSPSPEQVSVFGAIWIDVPVRQYLAALRRIQTWERGQGFNITRQISRPPRLDDFDALRLSADLVNDLRSCRVDDCELKLDASAIERARTSIDWSSPGRHAAAEALMRQVLHGYSTAYLSGGSDRLPAFRDKRVPVQASQEFRALVDELPLESPVLRQLRTYLVEYPRVALPGADSMLYWQEVEFGLKPTIRLSHMTILEGEHESFAASRMVYANHYFRSAVEMRALLPDPARGPGFWLTTLTASRTDGMTGFTGLFVRYRVQSRARDGVANMMRSAKRRLETGE